MSNQLKLENALVKTQASRHLSLSKSAPVRMCVICRQRFEKHELNRYVLSATGRLIKDDMQTVQGRGWYCCNGLLCQKKFALWKPKTQKRKSGGIVGR